MSKLSQIIFSRSLIILCMVSTTLSANDELSRWEKLSRHFKENKSIYLCVGAVCVAATAGALAYYFGAEENTRFEDDYCPGQILNPCWEIDSFNGNTYIELGPQSNRLYEEFLILVENCLDDSGKKCIPGHFSFDHMMADQFSFNTVDCSGQGMRSLKESYLNEGDTDCNYSLYLKMGKFFQKVGTLSFSILRYRRT